MGQPNNRLTSYDNKVSFITWKEIEADNSKFSQDLREIQKTVQDCGHKLIHIPVKIESLNQKIDEILQILPDLGKTMKI